MKLTLLAVTISLLSATEGVDLESKLRTELLAETLACELGPTESWLAQLSQLEDQTGECSDRISNILDLVSDLDTFTSRMSRAKRNAEEVQEKSESLADTLGKLKPLARVVKPLKVLHATAENILDKIADWLEKVIPKIDYIVDAVEQAKKLETPLDKAASTADLAGKRVALLREKFTGLRQGTINGGCACDDVLNTYSTGSVDAAAYDAALASYAACQGFFAPWSVVKLPSLDWIEEVNRVFEDWFGGVIREIEKVADKIGYTVCCTNVLAQIADLIGDVSSLATCFVDGALDFASERVMRLVEADLFDFDDVITDWIKSMQDAVSRFFKRTLDFQALTFNPKETFTSECPESTWRKIESRPYSWNMEAGGYDASGLSYSRKAPSTTSAGKPNGFLGSIADSCKEAVDDLKEPADACCDYYRVCDPLHQIFLYEGNSCTQNIAGTLTWSGEGRLTVTKTSDDRCLANDEARSVLLEGPMAAGQRIEVGDNSNEFGKDDNAVILLTKTLKRGESVCIPSFERSTSTGSYIVKANRKNGLDGKVSRYATFRPRPGHKTLDSDWSLKVARGLGWTNSFSEEERYSEANGGRHGPIVGISCSTNDCDNKSLLQAFDSSCRSSNYAGRWTSSFSEEKTSNTHCNFGEFVGQIQCQGSKCDEVSLKCIKPPSRCKLDSKGYASYVDVNQGSEARCPEGRVMTGARCYDSFCRRLRIFCTDMWYE